MKVIHSLLLGVTMIATMEAQKCDENEFQCGESGLCLPNQWMCDGQPDCSDGSDESPENCIPTRPPPPPPCKGFRCSSVDKCIPDAWLCDKSKDCIGGEDEGNIGYIHLASKNESNNLFLFQPHVIITCLLRRIVTQVWASFFARTDLDVSASPWFVMVGEIV